MTGAGSGELVGGIEGEFANSIIDSDSNGTPDLFGFGRNPTLEELNLDNQLDRLRSGTEVWSKESVKQNFEGAVNISAVISTDVHEKIEEIVFNDGGSGMTSGLAASARIFAGADYLTGTAERELLGCIPLEYSIDWEQGSDVSYSLSMAYADEEPGASADLSTATRAANGTTIPFHGATFTVDGADVQDLQSATLSISDIARLQYGGASPTANRGVIANPQASLEVEATFVTPSRTKLARGAPDGPPPDRLDSVTGSVTLVDSTGSTFSDYQLAALKPATYSWNNVLSTDDTTDSTTFNVDGGVTIA